MKQRSVRPKSRLVQRPGELAADDDECDNALHYAALEGDTEQLIELLAGARFPINSVGRRRWTPLHYAANAGELTVCRVLLERKADASLLSANNDSALHLLANRSYADADVLRNTVMLMLENKAMLTLRNLSGKTPAQVASSRGKSETASVLKELLRAQASATHTIPPSSFTSAPSVLRADPAERELSVGHKDNHSDGEADDSFGSRKSEKQKRFLRARSSDSIRSQAVGSTFATPPRNFTKPTIRLPSPPPPGLTLTGSPRAASTSTSSSSSKSSKPRRPRSSTLEAPLGDRATQIMPDTSLNPLPAPVPTLSSSTGSTSRSHRKSSSSKPSKKRIRRVSAASEFSTTSDTTTGGSDTMEGTVDSTSNWSETEGDEEIARQMRLLESRNRAEEELVSPRSLLLLSPRMWASTPKLARSITRSTARLRDRKESPSEVVRYLFDVEFSSAEPQFLNDFLLFFRLFLRDLELLQLLVSRFDLPHVSSLTKPELLVTRARVLDILRAWIQEYFPGREHALEFYAKVCEFVAAADVLCADERQISTFPVAEYLEFKSFFSQLTFRPWKALPPSFPGKVPLWELDSIDILAVDVDAVAQQLVLIDSELLASAPPLYLFHFHHIDSDDDPRIRTSCACVEALYARISLVRQWVVTEIVKQRDLTMRVEIIERFLRIAIKCESLSDFLSADAIAQGLHSPLVARLLNTWATLSRKTSNSFKEFLSAFGNRNNIAEYAKLVDEERPLIPNMEELAKELSAASKQKLVNTTTMVRLARICSHAQKTRYDLAPDDDLQQALQNLHVLPDSLAGVFSHSIEDTTTHEPAVITACHTQDLHVQVVAASLVVKSGTIGGLIDLLLDSRYLPVMGAFTDEFLVTRSQFISSHEFLRQLLLRLEAEMSPMLIGREAEQWCQTQAAVRSRVMQVLKRWFRHSYLDLKHDQAFLDTLSAWLSNAEMQSADETFFFLPNLLGSLSNQYSRNKRVCTVLKDDVQTFTIVDSTFTEDRMFDKSFPRDAARQLCLIDQKLFQAITANELLSRPKDKGGDEKNSGSSSPHNTNPTFGPGSKRIAAWSTRFNMVSQWAATCVVKQKDVQSRTQIIKQFIMLAWECMTLNNFNTSYAIVAGLNSSAIVRLKRCWDGLSVGTRTKFQQLEQLFDFRASHKNYREALRVIKPPIVPFLGIYTKDIFAVQENNPDLVPDTAHINFEKFSMLVRIIQDVLQYQTTSYTFEDDPLLQHFLRNVKPMDEEAVYEASIKRCEDNTPTVVRNPLFGQDRPRVASTVSVRSLDLGSITSSASSILSPTAPKSPSAASSSSAVSLPSSTSTSPERPSRNLGASSSTTVLPLGSDGSVRSHSAPSQRAALQRVNSSSVGWLSQYSTSYLQKKRKVTSVRNPLLDTRRLKKPLQRTTSSTAAALKLNTGGAATTTTTASSSTTHTDEEDSTATSTSTTSTVTWSSNLPGEGSK